MAVGTATAIGLGLAGAGSIIGGKKQNKAAAQGAEAQTQAAQIAADAQRQGFVDTTRLQQGRAQAGDAATARMLQLLGLPVPESLTSGSAYESIYSNAGGGFGGGDGGAQRANESDAKNYLAQNPDVSQEWQRVVKDPKAIKYLKNQGYSPDAQGFAKFHYDKFGIAEGRNFGTNGLAKGGAGGAGGGGQYALNVPDVTDPTELIQSTPGYKFRMSEGIKAIDSSAASRGMLLSGSQLRRLQDFGQEYAAQEYDKYFNRLASVSGAGQAATGDISGAAQRTGAGISNIQQNLGQGLASSYSQQTSPFANVFGTVGGGLIGYGG